MVLPKIVAEKNMCGLENEVNCQVNGSGLTLSVFTDNMVHRGKFLDREIIPYLIYENTRQKKIRKMRMAIKVEEEYKVKYNALRKRLQVTDPLADIKTATDIDKGYFTFLENYNRDVYRPLYKSIGLIYNVQLRNRQEKGYRKDTTLKIDLAHRKESRLYESSLRRYTEQVKLFDKFISADYEKSIECLRKAENFYVSAIVLKSFDLENLARIYCVTQSQLLGIDYLFRTQQKYGNFLYYLSPSSWRALHRDFARSIEIETEGFDLCTSNGDDTFHEVFDNLRNICTRGYVQPVLYFTEPSQVVAMFETQEKQQLHNFSHIVHLQPLRELLNKQIEYLRICIDNDAACLAHIINDLQSHIDFNEEKAQQLECKFKNILQGLFYDNVAATDVLRLKNNLEWCYERVFREKSTTSIADTAKALEKAYMNYTFDVESFCNEEIISALQQSIAEDKIAMEEAKSAVKELRRFERLQKSLLRSYGIQKLDDNNSSTTLVQNSRYKTKQKTTLTKKSKRLTSQRVLTDAEIDYLCLFTEWTENENPEKYLLRT